MASFRKCANVHCNVRLPDLKYDGHTLCATCVGHTCTLDNKCDECSLWPVEVFEAYLKHKHRLAVDRERKARHRQKAKLEKVSNKTTGVMTGNKAQVVTERHTHSISPSMKSSGQFSSPVPGFVIHDVSQNLFSSPTSSVISNLSLPKSLLNSPPAPLAPSRDQGVTVEAFNALVQNVAALNQSVISLVANQQVNVHSESVAPSGQVLGSMPAGGTGRDPQVSAVLCAQGAGGSVPGGESSPVGACPSDLESVPDRSRKRVRESKDSKSKVKRSRAGESGAFPSRSRVTQHGIDVTADSVVQLESNPVSFVSRDGVLGNVRDDRSESRYARNVRNANSVERVELRRDEVSLPPSSSSRGRFNTSMERALFDICAQFPHLSREEQVIKMKNYLHVNDPLNISYVSAKASPQVQEQGRKERVPDVSVPGFQIGGQPSGEKVGVVCPKQVSPPPSSHGPVSVGRVLAPKPIAKSASLTVLPAALSTPKAVQAIVPQSDSRLVREGNSTIDRIVENVLRDSSDEEVDNVRDSAVLANEGIQKCVPAEVMSNMSDASVSSSLATSSRKTNGRVDRPLVLEPEIFISTAAGGPVSSPLITVTSVGEKESVFVEQGALGNDVNFAGRRPKDCSETSHKTFHKSSSPILGTEPEIAGQRDKLGTSGQVNERRQVAIEVINSIKQDPSLSDLLFQPRSGIEGTEEEDPEDVSYAATYRKLVEKIKAKDPEVEGQSEIDLKTAYQRNRERKRAPVSTLRMSQAVKGRMQFLDKLLVAKKNSAKPVASFPLFLRQASVKNYTTDVFLDTSIPKSVLNAMEGILDPIRAKNLQNSKVYFSFHELENFFKAIFRQLEIWSFASSASDILADCFEDLKSKLSPQDQPLAEEYCSYIKCLDKAARHGIGEASHLFANLLLREREHVLDMMAKKVTQGQKSELLFAPISNFQAFDLEKVKESVKQITESSQSAAIVNAPNPPMKKFFPYFNPSPLAPIRGRQGRGGRGYGGRGGMSAQTKAYFKRRDRAIKRARGARGGQRYQGYQGHQGFQGYQGQQGYQ